MTSVGYVTNDQQPFWRSVSLHAYHVYTKIVRQDIHVILYYNALLH